MSTKGPSTIKPFQLRVMMLCHRSLLMSNLAYGLAMLQALQEPFNSIQAFNNNLHTHIYVTGNIGCLWGRINVSCILDLEFLKVEISWAQGNNSLRSWVTVTSGCFFPHVIVSSESNSTHHWLALNKEFWTGLLTCFDKFHLFVLIDEKIHATLVRLSTMRIYTNFSLYF